MPATSIQQNITLKLKQHYLPTHLEVINESDNHNVPAGSESHFKVIIVCDAFNDHTLIQRHRMINDTLADELKNQIHALALHTYTQADWAKKQKTAPVSPECLGGGK
ncbi:Cell division protein BolA [hydrothermal vent metagenome]|uniref:Cell division protein BolA n=1 Tax=hydrothermal vent metagenome TaxID=652676 RepID=A0A3B0Y556_9ZZZZ